MIQQGQPVPNAKMQAIGSRAKQTAIKIKPAVVSIVVPRYSPITPYLAIWPFFMSSSVIFCKMNQRNYKRKRQNCNYITVFKIVFYHVRVQFLLYNNIVLCTCYDYYILIFLRLFIRILNILTNTKQHRSYETKKSCQLIELQKCILEYSVRVCKSLMNLFK